MGVSIDYICDKCGLKLELNRSQSSQGFFCEVWEKYCPVANQIVHINSYWDCTEKEISCLIKNDMENVANCPEKDCTTECLEELVILEEDEYEGVILYKCPRHECEGKMHVDPNGVACRWD